MATTGAVLCPQYGPNLVEAESSGRKCVRLSATGQYVEFTAATAANALVVRYSVPDSPDGAGIDSTISLYRNGVFAQKLPVTSKYSWLYGAYPFSNVPKAAPRNFYDEVRQKDVPIAAGDKIRIQKDTTDTAGSYCIIDLVDLEHVAPPLSKPAGDWLPRSPIRRTTPPATEQLTTRPRFRLASTMRAPMERMSGCPWETI